MQAAEWSWAEINWFQREIRRDLGEDEAEDNVTLLLMQSCNVEHAGHK